MSDSYGKNVNTGLRTVNGSGTEDVFSTVFFSAPPSDCARRGDTVGIFSNVSRVLARRSSQEYSMSHLRRRSRKRSAARRRQGFVLRVRVSQEYVLFAASEGAGERREAGAREAFFQRMFDSLDPILGQESGK